MQKEKPEVAASPRAHQDVVITRESGHPVFSMQ